MKILCSLFAFTGVGKIVMKLLNTYSNILTLKRMNVIIGGGGDEQLNS